MLTFSRALESSAMNYLLKEYQMSFIVLFVFVSFSKFKPYSNYRDYKNVSIINVYELKCTICLTN